MQIFLVVEYIIEREFSIPSMVICGFYEAIAVFFYTFSANEKHLCKIK